MFLTSGFDCNIHQKDLETPKLSTFIFMLKNLSHFAAPQAPTETNNNRSNNNNNNSIKKFKTQTRIMLPVHRRNQEDTIALTWGRNTVMFASMTGSEG